MITPELKIKLKEEFRKETNRDPSPNEEGNLENDYILIMRVLMREVEAIKNFLKMK